jgi:hypothetical protein
MKKHWIKLGDLIKDQKGHISNHHPARAFGKPVTKEQINEYINLSDPVNDVRDHFEKFSKDMDNKRLGSFDADSGEYHSFEGGDNKLYGKRHKQLSAWEKKVKKTLDSLLKDYVKAWK